MHSVLIVDDEKDNLDALNRLLRRDFEVVLAISPIEAIKKIQQKEYSVLVSDQRMPEMTGVELLEKARQIRPRTTRVLLTGYTDIASVIDAINRGNVYRYIAKPWDPEEFKMTLRQAAEAYALRSEVDTKNELLEKANRELKQAFEELKTLDIAKARFLSLISHELNTPLTVLTSFSELLTNQKGQLPKEVQKSIRAIQNATDRLSDIVQEVITFVKLESTTQLSLEKTDLVEILGRVEKQMQPIFQNKGIDSKLTQPRSLPLTCDSEKIHTALEYFLRDAALRVSSPSQIEITVEKEEDSVHITLTHSGPPVTQKELEPFEATAELQHHHKNLGLALAIVKHIAELHGGELTAKKKGLALRLPLSV